MSSINQPHSLTALAMDTLANQTCSVVRRRPASPTPREVQVALAAAAFLRRMCDGLDATEGIRTSKKVSPRNVEVSGFAVRARVQLGRLASDPEHPEVGVVLKRAVDLLDRVADAHDFTTIGDADTKFLILLFTMLAEPAVQDLRASSTSSRSPRSWYRPRDRAGVK